MYYFMILFFISSVSFAQKIKPTTEALWVATNNLTNVADTFVNNYRLRRLSQTEPLAVALEKPENVQKAANAIKIEWAKEVEKNFSEKEIVYLTQLYSHPMMKKAIKFDENFWNAGIMHLIPRAVNIKPQKKPEK